MRELSPEQKGIQEQHHSKNPFRKIINLGADLVRSFREYRERERRWKQSES